jgi:hypothetical protein
MKAKLSKEAGGYDLYRIDKDGKRVTFASTQDYKQKLSLKNCQAIERGYDLDELGDEYYKQFDNLPVIRDNAYTAGFQKALDLNNTKLYTLEDMMNCWNKGLKFQDHKETLGEHIQSLQQTEWDVKVEMECVMGCQNLILNGENSVCCGDKKPKLDADGCLILKLKSE